MKLSFAVVLVALVAVACAKDLSSLEPFPCALDGTCPGGFVCNQALAPSECVPVSASQHCQLNSECTSPLVCTAGACRTPCATNSDCADAEVVEPEDAAMLAIDAASDGSMAQVVDSGSAAFPFQPSNVSLSEIAGVSRMARDENVSGSCSVSTDATAPEQDCFSSPIKPVTQPDGSTVNLIVVKSLAIQSTGAIGVTGGVPLVVVSLSNVTILGASIDAASAGLSTGPGGAGAAASNANGMGPGGGTAGSGSATVGGSGGSYCGIGGLGGGQTALGIAYGGADIRPLVGGSAGGGGAVGSGAGGGAIQISAAGTMALSAGSTLTVGGQGGPIAGLAADQNAGGGGSGGSILLEATSVTVAGTLAANGGGGGGAYTGAGGADATPSATPAAGGTAGASGAAGGAGGAAATSNGLPGQSGVGKKSGGGGGGTGRIRINSMSGVATVTGVLSPSFATSCVAQGPLRTAAAGP
jgi:hypothetical protein